MAKIDLSKLTPAQLEAIGNEVLRNLAQRLKAGATRADPMGPYDKHTSNHMRNTIVEEVIEAGATFE